jgi:hypothetical protein
VPFEVDLMKAAGFIPACLPLGPLRCDVACIALLAVAAASFSPLALRATPRQ